MYKIRVRKSLVFDKNEKNLEKKVKKIGTYLTYIGTQKRAGARFCAPLGLYKARGTELIATWLPYKQKETLISSAEPENFGFWYLSDARRMHFNVEILTIFKLGVKCLPESNSTRKVMLF